MQGTALGRRQVRRVRKGWEQMKSLFGLMLSLFRWLIELNEIVVDHLARCLSLIALVAAGVFAAWYVREVQASRNSSGTYSLATSPVTTTQTISTSLWNNTFSDLATGVTDSLDRNGRGGM